ncbi:MBOAT family protein [Sulfuricurvum sp.]|uniref:MBOAT family O-acyltransferase n=1 Tax=Sulfuricurvum sp. TaxID=2025608 RepID=UPI00263280C1|nr:MBOAT family protein [Sulfuricurvum sp.]MDD2266020.1 MBOAT family protein [Sulfuricurvum sp.]MDD2783032.1 MBOAT family protein [Sulfuricurvum sp.]
MLFNSYEFIFLFLPITLFIYFLLNKKRLTYASKGWMVLASLFFYSWWNILYLPLILGSILVNFTVGSTISKMESLRSPSKKAFSPKTLLTFGILSNLFLLGYFKYMDFFITNANMVLGMHWELMHIILPLGISFFTFTQIAYLVDAYRGEVKEMDYLNYTLFVTFFPHLLAGPILHHKEMMPQFDGLKNKVIQYKNISAGLFLFSIGFFKKVIIADTFSVWANTGFDTTSALNLLEAWATSLSYTFQLYFDFSGYTDMALGVALLFNIRLPVNFNSPYKALNIQDFWRRWHITLSRFLRDYIYIPLGGNRSGELRTYANLFSVFLIGGLWHGASWMFVAWGALHGSAIVLHRAWQQTGLSVSRFFGWFITFNFVNITWVFFRAKDWDQAANVLHGMIFGDIIVSEKLEKHLNVLKSAGIEFGQFMIHLGGSASTWIWIVSAFILVIATPNSNSLTQRFYPSKFNLAAIVIVLLDALLHLSKNSEFLYFNF